MVSDEKYNIWDIEASGEKRFDLMSKNEMLEMYKSGLVEFGGHTLHHPKLDTLTEKEQRYENTGRKIIFFCLSLWNI